MYFILFKINFRFLHMKLMDLEILILWTTQMFQVYLAYLILVLSIKKINTTRIQENLSFQKKILIILKENTIKVIY
jgi:hypothetical protein